MSLASAFDRTGQSGETSAVIESQPHPAAALFHCGQAVRDVVVERGSFRRTDDLHPRYRQVRAAAQIRHRQGHLEMRGKPGDLILLHCSALLAQSGFHTDRKRATALPIKTRVSEHHADGLRSDIAAARAALTLYCRPVAAVVLARLDEIQKIIQSPGAKRISEIHGSPVLPLRPYSAQHSARAIESNPSMALLRVRRSAGT